MKFSRTAIFGWVTMILGGLGLVGLDFPIDQIELLLNRITDDALELWFLISGPAVLWFRKITRSPVAKGLLGFLGFKDEEK